MSNINPKIQKYNDNLVTGLADGIVVLAASEGLTTKDIAERTGLHWDTIHKNVGGIRSPNFKTLALVATALNRTVPDLLIEVAGGAAR